MKFLKYFLVWVCVAFFLTSLAGYVYVRLEGKRFFEKQLTRFFGQTAEIEYIRYLVPGGIRLTNLRIHNVLEVDDVRVHLRIPFFLGKRFIIARMELENPVFHLVRYAEKKVDFGGVYLRTQEEKFHPVVEMAAAKVFQSVMIDLLSVQEGELMLVDLAVEEPVKYHLTGVKGKAMKVVYPLEDQQIRFDVHGVIRGTGGPAFLKQAGFSAEGWVNWPLRAMDAVLDVRRQEGFSAKMALKGKDNQLQIRGRVEMDMAAASPGIFTDSSQSGLEGLLAGVLQGSESKVMLNVNMDTQMDAFSFGMVNFEGAWEVPQHKKDQQDRLSPAALFGIAPAITGAADRK